MKGDLRVEIVVRNKSGKSIDWSKYGINELPANWVLLETVYKLSINVPLDWKGFRDGTVHRMLADFNDLVYIALAYYTDNTEIVTDGDGHTFSSYDANVDGKCMRKYVKKRLRIINTIDEKRGAFEVQEFILDLGSSTPAFKVLDVYSVGSESILKHNYFINEGMPL